MSDEFYIGYETKMAPGLSRRVRAAAAALLTLAVAVPVLLLAAQGRFSNGTFEFGSRRTVEGRLVEFPYPALDVDERSGSGPGFYWLVGPGKHGAAAIVHGLDGRRVRVRGTRIERDGDAMLEIEPGTVEPVPGDPSRIATPLERTRTVRLTGEIVDSKCHLGVMKPGEGPTHRDCAVRCLFGSVTPFVLVHGSPDLPARLALVDEHDRPFSADFSTLAGRPVAITGTLVAQRSRHFLSARVSDIELMR